MADTLLQALAGLSPVAAQLAALADPYIMQHTGFSVQRLMNPMGLRTDEHRFSLADTMMMQPLRESFRAHLYGASTGSMVGNILNQGYMSLVEGTQTAELSFINSMRYAGAVQSFSKSRGLNLTTMSGSLGNRASTNDVTAAYMGLTKGSGPLNMGERAQIIEQMVGLGSVTGLSTDGGTNVNNQKMTELKRNIKGMETALSDWKAVLGKDLPGVLDTLNSIFGGNTIATFNNSARTFQSQALALRHVAAVSGVGMGEILGNASAVGKSVVGYGGNASMSLSLAGFVTAYSSGAMGGYMATPDAIQRGVQDVGAQAVTSRGGRAIMGAYAKWRVLSGNQALSDDEAMAKFNGLLPKGKFSISSLNEALGMNFSGNQYIDASGSSYGRTYGDQNASLIAEMSMRDRVRAYREEYIQASPDAQKFLNETGTSPEDFFGALRLGPGDKMAKLILLGKGKVDPETIGQVASEPETVHDRLRNTPGTVAQSGGNLNFYETGAMFANAEAGAANSEESRARVGIDAELNVGGTRLAAAAKMLREDKTASVKMLFKVLTGAEFDTSFHGIREDEVAAINATVEGMGKRETAYNEYRVKKDLEVLDLGVVTKTLMTQYVDAGRQGNTILQKKLAGQISTLTGRTIDDKTGNLGKDTGIVASNEDIDAIVEDINKGLTPEGAMQNVKEILESASLTGETKTQEQLDAMEKAEKGSTSSYNHFVAKARDIQKAAILSTLSGKQRAAEAKTMQDLQGDPEGLDAHLAGYTSRSVQAAQAVAETYKSAGMSSETVLIGMLISQLKTMLVGLFDEKRREFQ